MVAESEAATMFTATVANGEVEALGLQ